MKKIISYNVNGIRATMQKGFIDFLKTDNPDIVCIQEIKAEKSQIDVDALLAAGYQSYWFSAEKKGYSGVGILSKAKPDKLVYGMNISKYDNEGRLMRADFGALSIISVYHPSGSSGDERQSFKMTWLDDFSNYISQLKQEKKNLVICGDFNICRLWIDIHNPDQQQDSSGFLPEERDWFSRFVDSGFCDTFRRIHPEEKDRYSWWSYRAGARAKNKGWRIDYVMISEHMKDRVVDAFILPEYKQSDHCPVGVVLK